MNAAMYRDILEENLLQSALNLRLGQRFIFQQVTDPKHTAKISKDWLSGQLFECPRVAQPESRLESH